MPLYEYRCSKCDTVFERIQKFADPPLTVHEGCGGAVERLLSAPGLHFKGSGWYVTDYKNSGSKPDANGKTDSKPSETKTESKPAEGSKPAESPKKND
jgi:putative FmdB family regulatory protein